jgi:hypothetical protein
MRMINCLVWLFGRGASSACGLTWTVPGQWRNLDRDRQIEMIKLAISREMDAPNIDTMPYKNLINQLSETKSNWHHRFVTTNWDYLLQREIDKMGWSVATHWLPETHVSHLNGTVEDFGDPSFRSRFLLETDPASIRQQTIEANIAFNHLIWQRYFIVLGMSFSCEMDRSFLDAISRVQDDLPIGESSWLIIDNSEDNLNKVASHIKSVLPRADIAVLLVDFVNWAKGPMRELKALGVLNT